MFPTIFEFGPVTLRTYGLLVAAGLFFGLRYMLSRANRFSITKDSVYDAVLFAVLFGIIGARLNYVVVEWDLYAGNLIDIFKVWQGGLVYYGGFVSAAGTIFFFAARRKINIWKLTDIFAPAVALGHVFGRLGCFFAGCCYGRECHLPWAVEYTSSAALAPTGISLHPVQLYEAAGNFVIFLFLDGFLRRNNRPGRVLAMYLALYSALRFAVEFFRGDERGSYILGLSPAQSLSLLSLLAGLIIFFTRKNER